MWASRGIFMARVAGTYLDTTGDYLIERKKLKTREEGDIIKMKGWVPDVTKNKEDENGCKCRQST